MVGAFMLNGVGRACLVQFADYAGIAALRLVEGHLCCITYEDGTDDIFTDEIHPQIFDALRLNVEVLVANLGSEGQVEREYLVPLTVSLS